MATLLAQKNTICLYIFPRKTFSSLSSYQEKEIAYVKAQETML